MEILLIKHTFLTKVHHYSDQFHHYLLSFTLPRMREAGKWYSEWWCIIIFSQTRLSPTKVPQSKASNVAQQMGASLLTSIEEVALLETGEACTEIILPLKCMGKAHKNSLRTLKRLHHNDTCMHYLRALLTLNCELYLTENIWDGITGPRQYCHYPWVGSNWKLACVLSPHQVPSSFI